MGRGAWIFTPSIFNAFEEGEEDAANADVPEVDEENEERCEEGVWMGTALLCDVGLVEATRMWVGYAALGTPAGVPLDCLEAVAALVK
jgi:hypothetical protein